MREIKSNYCGIFTTIDAPEIILEWNIVYHLYVGWYIGTISKNTFFSMLTKHQQWSRRTMIGTQASIGFYAAK